MRSALATALLLFSVLSFGQMPKENPLVTKAQSFGEVGLKGETASGVSPLKFKPSGKYVYLDAFAMEYAEEAEGAAALKEAIVAGIKEYEIAAKEAKMETDGAFAHAFSILLLQSILLGKEFDDADYMALTGQFRKAFAGVKATDKQKQEFYEWTLGSAFVAVALGSALEGEEAETQLKQLAELEITILTGAEQSQISFSKSMVIITGRGVSAGPEEPTKSTGELAPGFSYSLPEGWVEEAGWLKRAEAYLTSDLISANIRFLPAMKAGGEMGATLRTLWEENMPEELKGKSSGMVFRRYIGDGLPAFFIFGQGKITGQQADSLYSLYIVDCGAYWQPFVVAQTWHDPTTEFPLGVMFSAPGSFGNSSDIAEVFFKTMKCPSGEGRALVDKAAIVGNYSYGSSSSLQWENIYTGASSMTFVSYGGTLNFAVDGTLTYTFSSASGQVGAARFGQQKGNGTWKLEGDILTCHWKFFDQGDGYQAKDYVYRVAGVISYTDGVKVLVLKNKLDLPINAVTVRDSSDYYTTKKKQGKNRYISKLDV